MTGRVHLVGDQYLWRKLLCPIEDEGQSQSFAPGALHGKTMTVAFQLADLVVKHLRREGELPCA
jgi:hypothetical protein